MKVFKFMELEGKIQVIDIDAAATAEVRVINHCLMLIWHTSKHLGG